MSALEKVILGPDSRHIVLLDSAKSAQVIYVEVLEKNLEMLNRPPPNLNSKLEPLKAQLKARKNLQVVKLHKVQVIDCAQIEIKVPVLLIFDFIYFSE